MSQPTLVLSGLEKLHGVSTTLQSLSDKMAADNAAILAKLEAMGGAGGASQGLQVRVCSVGRDFFSTRRKERQGLHIGCLIAHIRSVRRVTSAYAAMCILALVLCYCVFALRERRVDGKVYTNSPHWHYAPLHLVVELPFQIICIRGSTIVS